MESRSKRVRAKQSRARVGREEARAGGRVRLVKVRHPGWAEETPAHLPYASRREGGAPGGRRVGRERERTPLAAASPTPSPVCLSPFPLLHLQPPALLTHRVGVITPVARQARAALIWLSGGEGVRARRKKQNERVAGRHLHSLLCSLLILSVPCMAATRTKPIHLALQVRTRASARVQEGGTTLLRRAGLLSLRRGAGTRAFAPHSLSSPSPTPQALAGLTLGGIAYTSLKPTRPALPPRDSEASLTAALADTSGRVWGLNETAPAPSSSPPPPAPSARSGR